MNDVEIGLLNFALDHGIGVTIRRDIPESMPSFCRTDIKKIMVNATRHDYIFAFAHEIGHILNNDIGANPMFYTATNRSKIEADANRMAIKLLLPYYCKNRELDMISSTGFVESFKAPAWLDYVAQDEINKYFSGENLWKKYVQYVKSIK